MKLIYKMIDTLSEQAVRIESLLDRSADPEHLMNQVYGLHLQLMSNLVELRDQIVPVEQMLEGVVDHIRNVEKAIAETEAYLFILNSKGNSDAKSDSDSV